MVEERYVQCIRYQSAECPIVVGGIYKVHSVGAGVLYFDRCRRDHNSEFFKEVPYVAPTPIAFQEGDLVRPRAGVLHGTKPCLLTPGIVYRAGTIDDLNRVFVHHSLCDEWHSAEDFEVPQDRPVPLKLAWKPYQDALGEPCVEAQFLCHGLYVGETSWHASNHSGRLAYGSCTSHLDGQDLAEAWLKQHLRSTFERLYGP